MLLALAIAAFGCAGEENANMDTAGGEASDAAPLPPDLGTMSMTPQVVLETNMGRIVMELDREKAPKTVENILWHVQNGFYDGLTFHRVMPGFMIQTGSFTAELAQRQSPKGFIQNEADNGLKNVRGTVAMARMTDPQTASAGFYINHVDNAKLDHTAPTPSGWGYAVFGHVVEGMDVVDAIAQTPTQSVGRMNDVPVEPVIIERAYIEH
jgi:cyclophilin family peptidyl-prolyl cis-trans isomerase